MRAAALTLAIVALIRLGYIAGALRNHLANLVRWIRDPQAIEPGTVMPKLGVTELEARDIASHLTAPR